jgi:hypothetical protein
MSDNNPSWGGGVEDVTAINPESFDYSELTDNQLGALRDQAKAHHGYFGNRIDDLETVKSIGLAVGKGVGGAISAAPTTGPNPIGLGIGSARGFRPCRRRSTRGRATCSTSTTARGSTIRRGPSRRTCLPATISWGSSSRRRRAPADWLTRSLVVDGGGFAGYDGRALTVVQDLGVTQFADLAALMSEAGGDTHIQFAEGSEIVLQGVAMSLLHEDDFAFA